MIVLTNAQDGDTKVFLYEGGFVQFTAQGSTQPGMNTTIDVIYGDENGTGVVMVHMDLTVTSPDFVQVYLPPGQLTCRPSAAVGVNDIMLTVNKIPG